MTVNDNDELANRAHNLLVRMCGLTLTPSHISPILDTILNAQSVPVSVCFSSAPSNPNPTVDAEPRHGRCAHQDPEAYHQIVSTVILRAFTG